MADACGRLEPGQVTCCLSLCFQGARERAAGRASAPQWHTLRVVGYITRATWSSSQVNWRGLIAMSSIFPLSDACGGFGVCFGVNSATWQPCECVLVPTYCVAWAWRAEGGLSSFNPAAICPDLFSFRHCEQSSCTSVPGGLI